MSAIVRGSAAILILLFGSFGFAESPQSPFEPAVPDEVMNALFQQSEGWIGADGAYSVPLALRRTLWLFGDTWVGKIKDGSRAGSAMVNSSVAIQEGTGKDAQIKFLIRRNGNDKPAALLVPDDGKGWFWLQSGVRVGDPLYLFLAQIEKTETPGVFGFRQIGQWLGVVANPDDDPLSWRITQHKIACTLFSPERQINFGAAALAEGENLFIYGTHEDRRAGGLKRHLILARAPANKIEDFDAWRFFDGGQWVGDHLAASHLFDGMASEGSVSY